jgi:outer membrane receptor for ferrienterochelin and colicins
VARIAWIPALAGLTWVLSHLAAPRAAAAQAPPARVTVRVTAEGAPLAHAVARAGDGPAARGAETNAAGVARLVLPPGEHLVRVTLLGYAPDSARLTVGAGRDTTLAFELRAAAAELSGVVVTSARGAQRIEDEPTRVEVLSGEDVAEKTEMRPADLRNFLSEMAGVRVQQMSAATGASGLRLQGLRPRYTLLLADGLPLYGGAGGGGLDIMQLPPADLRQVEVVKGPASALYGPSALGGMVNLVSKRPGHEGDVLLQGTGQQGANAFGWLSRKVSDAWGYTGVVGAHAQRARDMDGDGWVDLPSVRRVEARPRLFVDAPNGASLFVTGGATAEDREGGEDQHLVNVDGISPYVERVATRRGDVGAVAHRLVGGGALLQLRASANVDRKSRRFGFDPEHVTRSTGFAELSVAGARGAHDLLAGAALDADAARVTEYRPLDYTFTTASLFAQDAWRPTSRVSLTGSARLDAHSRYGARVSPRASLLVKLGGGWNARASATHGFYAPTPFVEEAEAVGVRRVRGFDALDAELADYGALDLNGTAGPLELNGTLFASRVSHQVVADEDRAAPGTLRLANAEARARSRGAELFAVYDAEPFLVTALYTLTAAREPAAAAGDATREAPYTPRQAGGLDMTWEDAERGLWIALEGFYTGPQALDDDPYRERGRPYTVVGLLVSQRVGRYKVFFNVDNLTDVRQSRWSPIVLPARSPGGRRTTNPWAPIEGRVLSAGVRVSSGDLAHHAP